MAVSELANPRLTVAIPLFMAAPWFETIVENIRRIPCNTLILLSDETSSDNTAQRVAAIFEDDPRIRVRLRKGKSGWREHCNSLILECETEFFNLLPQDDLVSPEYYEKLVSALDNNPDAGLAFGSLIAEGGRYSQPTQFPPPQIQLGMLEPWMEAIELESMWNLGIPFRGVIRKTILRTIPPTHADQFADQIWVFGMALSAHLIEVPDAMYLKRYHAGNTHDLWSEPALEDRKTQLITEIRRVLGNNKNAELAINRLNQKYQILHFEAWHKFGIC